MATHRPQERVGCWRWFASTRTMRADNWRAQYGDRRDTTGRAFEAEMLEAFRPAHRDRERRVVASDVGLVAQALDRLPGAWH